MRDPWDPEILVFVHILNRLAGFRAELLQPLVQEVAKKINFFSIHRSLDKPSVIKFYNIIIRGCKCNMALDKQVRTALYFSRRMLGDAGAPERIIKLSWVA